MADDTAAKQKKVDSDKADAKRRASTPKAYSAAHNKAKYRKQREDAEAKGDQGTTDKIYKKLGKKSPSVAKDPVSRFNRFMKNDVPSPGSMVDDVNGMVVGSEGMGAAGKLAGKAVGEGAGMLGRLGKSIGSKMSGGMKDLEQKAEQGAEGLMKKMTGRKVRGTKPDMGFKGRKVKNAGKKNATPAPKPSAAPAPKPSAAPRPERTPRPAKTPKPAASAKPSPAPKASAAPSPKASAAPKPSSTPRPARTPSPPDVREKAKSDYEAHKAKNPQRKGETKQQYNKRTYAEYRKSKKAK